MRLVGADTRGRWAFRLEVPMGLRVAGDGDVFLIAGEVAGQRDDVAMVNLVCV